MTVPGVIRSDIRLGDLVFNAADANGCLWIINDLDGWWNLPDVDLPDDSRPYQYDGSYPADGRFKAREITVTGTLLSPGSDVSSVVAARNRLLTACASVRKDLLLSVDEPDATKTALMRLSSRPQIGISKLNGTLTFQLTLRSPDPLKYASNVSVFTTTVYMQQGGRGYPLVHPRTYPTSVGSTGVVRVVNQGNYASGVRLDITGPIANPQVENIDTGEVLSFNIQLQAFDTLTVDTAQHSVVLNGTASRRSTLDPTSSWFLIGANGSSLRFRGTRLVGASTNPLLTATYRSAWIS